MKRAARTTSNTNKIIILPTPESEEPVSGNAGGARVIEFSPGRISIDKLRPVWNDKEVTYTDEELFQIREWLYVMAEVIISEFDRRRHINHTIPLNLQAEQHAHNQPNHEAQKSHPLRPRIHRRAS